MYENTFLGIPPSGTADPSISANLPGSCVRITASALTAFRTPETAESSTYEASIFGNIRRTIRTAGDGPTLPSESVVCWVAIR